MDRDAYFAVAVPARAVDLLPEEPPRPRVTKTVLGCIAVGAACQAAYLLLTRDVEAEAAIRYAFVTTLAVYVVVAAVLVRAARGLHWRNPGLPALGLSVATGLGLGAGLAFFLLRGDLVSNPGDPRLALMVSEGAVSHIVATVLIAVVAAPLCEEVLFRGLLLGSLAPSSRRVAVWVSAFAFAAWHLSPKALLYYSLFGALFGALYLRRGLVCSIAAHAAFNGTLVLAATAYALGPGVTVSGSGLVLSAPPGWHVAEEGGLHLRGPSAGEVRVEVVPGFESLDLDTVADRIASGVLDSDVFGVLPETARTVSLPVGEAVRVRVRYDGRDGDVVLFAARGRVYAVELLSGGSLRVRADFEEILRDLRLSS